MNFKTTVVLIVLLLAAGLTLFFTRDRGGTSETPAEAAKKAQKVFDVNEADLTKLAITSAADGKKLTLEQSNGKWRLTEPVNAPADSFSVDALVRALTGLESRGEVSGGSADAKSTGLDNPRYTIDLSTKDGKSYTLLVGDKLPVGDNLYVSRKDKGDKLVVSADLLEKLDKPAADYRDKKLVSDYSTAGVMQVTINKPDGKIVIARNNVNDDWKVVEPAPAMPAERSDVDSIVTTVTGLTASEYVSDDPTQAKMYQLDPPRMSAVLSSAPPATQPTATKPTSQPAPIVVKFGRYDDVLKSNVFAMTSQSPAIAKVSASSLDAINKKPLDLRDRRAMDIDPAQVASVRIIADVAATTKPTSKPASKADVHITRRKEPPVLVLAPTSKPATGPATTQAASQPATKPTVAAATKPASKWEVFGAGSGATTQPSAAEDSKIDTLLSSLHPLRVRKYLDKAPTTQPTATYVVTLVTQAAGGASPVNQELTLVDPGNGGDVTGTYNGLAFEVDRFFLDHLTGDFKKGAANASPSPAMNEGRRLTHLGRKSVLTEAQIDRPRSILDTFDNPKPQRDYEVKFVFAEFTSMCPVTGQPDFATITVSYVPDKRCVEMKSLKLYFLAYRNKGIFFEAVVNTILDDLVAVLKPRWMTVVGDFAVRGGTAGIVTATHEEKRRR